jgi:hypothetical protein
VFIAKLSIPVSGTARQSTQNQRRENMEMVSRRGGDGDFLPISLILSDNATAFKGV